MTRIIEQYQQASETSFIGKLLVRNPGAKTLYDWCRANLHASFSSVVSLGQGFFEVLFLQPKGRVDALSRSDFSLQGKYVLFSPWAPSFDPHDATSIAVLSFPIWTQLPALNSHLRNVECLKQICRPLGTVLMVEDAEAYLAKTGGLHVRLLVQDLTKLRRTVTVGAIRSFPAKVCRVKYTGLPELCPHCSRYGYCICSQDAAAFETSMDASAARPLASTLSCCK
jgi:hypothetical protein